MSTAVSVLAGIGGLYLAFSLLAAEVYVLHRREERRRKRRDSAGPS